MDSCSDNSLNILRYLDNQLSGPELEAFAAHLKTCKECMLQLGAEQALSRLLRDSVPLYTAPLALRTRVSSVLNQTPGRSPISQRLRRVWLGLVRWAPSWSLPLPALLMIVAALIFIPGVTRQVSAASYVSAAATAHRGYLDGNLPLQIQSDSPEVVTAWFSGKLPFTFRPAILPAGPDHSVDLHATPGRGLSGVIRQQPRRFCELYFSAEPSP